MKTLPINVYATNPVGQKKGDYQMIQIPLFYFCCHHHYLVMSEHIWYLAVHGLKKKVYCQQLFQKRINAQGVVHKQQLGVCNQAGINQVRGNFYCGEQNNAKPVSCLGFWLPNNLSFV